MKILNYAYNSATSNITVFFQSTQHEVKREIEGICEKLKLNNFHEEEIKFLKMVEESVSHELSVDYYEKDVMYGIIGLLTTLAYER